MREEIAEPFASSDTSDAPADVARDVEKALKAASGRLSAESRETTAIVRKRMEAARRYTEALAKELPDAPRAKKKDTWQRILARVDAERADARVKLTGAQKQVAERKNALKAASTKNDELAKRVDSTAAELKKALAEQAKKTTRAQHLSSAVAAAKKVRTKVASTLKKRRAHASRREVWDEFSACIKKQRDAAKHTAEKQAATNALAGFGLLPPPAEIPLFDDSQFVHYDRPTAKDVLDRLIDALQLEYLQATRVGGRESAQAKRIAESLEAAYEHRSGFVYIRPAMSYLRTSFPTTTLQRAAPLGWENMLFQHGRRQIPLAERWFEPGNKDLPTIQEIDKQFWQNINRVRVAGAGDTNYVVAKDDIGNWYVKNYSSDPKDIIESARSLALFAMGPQLDADLLGRTLSRSKEGAKDSAADAIDDTGAKTETRREDGAAKSSIRGQQLVSAKKVYRTRTVEDEKLLVDTIKALRDEIESAWKREAAIEAKLDGEALESALDEEVVRLSDYATPVAEDETKSPDELTALRAERVIGGLHALRRFHNGVQARLDGAAREPLTAASGESDEKKSERAAIRAALGRARVLLTETVRHNLVAVLEKRKESVGRLGTALEIISEPAS